MGSLQAVQRHAPNRLIGGSKLAVGVNVRVNGWDGLQPYRDTDEDKRLQIIIMMDG